VAAEGAGKASKFQSPDFKFEIMFNGQTPITTGFLFLGTLIIRKWMIDVWDLTLERSGELPDVYTPQDPP
jgi:hypothetical protein